MSDIGDMPDNLRKKRIQIRIDELKVAIQRAEASIIEFRINSDKQLVEVEIYNADIAKLEEELNITTKEG